MACGGDGAYAHAQRLWSELKDAVVECCYDGPLDPRVPRILAELGPARIAALQDADEQLGEGGPITNLFAGFYEDDRYEIGTWNGPPWADLEQEHRVVGQLLSVLQDAGVRLRGHLYANFPHNIVLFCRLGMDMTGIDITTDCYYDPGDGGFMLQAGHVGQCPWDPNWMGLRARTPEVVTDADMEAGAPPGLCGHAVVRAMLDAGANMWPFHLPGVDRDHPVARADIKHDGMAAIVWPGEFPDLDEQITIDANGYSGMEAQGSGAVSGFQADTGGGLSRWLFAYFAKKRERLRRQANWDRRRTAFMCLLRHSAGAAVAAAAAAGGGGTVAKKTSSTNLDGLASMMIRLYKQQVAIREIIAFL